SFSNENAHERDALSAAVQAWRANQNVLRSARITDARMEPREKERLMHLLLNGYRHEFALEMLKEESDERGKTRARESAQRDEGRDPDAPKPGQADSQKRPLSIVESRDQRLALERANAELRKRISLLENERDELAGRIRLLENGVRSKLAGEMQYRRMSQRIEMLEKRVEYEQGLSRHLYKKLAQADRIVKEAGRTSKQAQKKDGGTPKELRRGEGQDYRQTERGMMEKRVFPPALANEANLKGLDSSVLESLIRQYRRSRAGAFDKEK
ncbi:MAG: hypothetical protein V1728_06490, partial [Candidatus Micrarchaeota archaeon]